MSSLIRATFAVAFAASLALTAPISAIASDTYSIHNETGNSIILTSTNSPPAGMPNTAPPSVSHYCLAPHAGTNLSFNPFDSAKVVFNIKHSDCHSATIHSETRYVQSTTYVIRESNGRYSVRP